MKKLIIISMFALLFVLPFSNEISYSQISNFESNLNIPKLISMDELEKWEKEKNNDEKEIDFIVMLATAYTKSKEEGTQDGITASGTQVSRGTIATDPRVIPLGTKLYIDGYGEAIALDRAVQLKAIELICIWKLKKKHLNGE